MPTAGKGWVASEVGLVGGVASEAESDPSLVIVQNKFNRKIPFQPIGLDLNI